LKNFITRYKSAIILLFVVIGLIGCATQPLPTGIDPPGFWMGIAHGFLIFFSMIGRDIGSQLRERPLCPRKRTFS
jgi:hypothetical protein